MSGMVSTDSLQMQQNNSSSNVMVGGHGSSADDFSHTRYHRDGGGQGHSVSDDLDDEGGNDLADEIESSIYHGISEQQEQHEPTAAEALSSSMKMFNYKPKSHQPRTTKESEGTNQEDGVGTEEGGIEDHGDELETLKPPKKPLSAFFFFSGERRPALQKEFPGKLRLMSALVARLVGIGTDLLNLQILALERFK